MPYLNVDDRYPEHPKIDALTDGAFRLHVALMAYCARERSDALVPRRKIPRLTPNYRPAHLTELLEAGAVHQDGCGTPECPSGKPGHLVVHDYLEWNKSRQWWDDKREADAKRLAKWREEQARKQADERKE